jgi:hypothetical protein
MQKCILYYVREYVEIGAGQNYRNYDENSKVVP